MSKKMSLQDLAKEIVDFLEDFDTYDFRDNFESKDDALRETMDLLVKDSYAILNYLDDVIDYFDNDDDIGIYNHALKIINKVENFIS